MNPLYYVGILIGFLASCCDTVAEPTAASIPYSVRIWQTDDGLPQSSVFAIAQTPDGYLWVGTHDGLARFDGVRFVLIDDPALPELKHASITALCTASDGTLWIATEGNGLIGLRAAHVTRLTEAEGLPNNVPRCLLETADGSLWIGSDAGLSRYRDGKLVNFTEKSGLGDNSVRALAADREGLLRIATRRGLSTLNKNGVLSTTNIGTNMIANALKAVAADQRGTLWVGANDGLTSLPGARKLGPAEGLPDKIITTIFEDRAGQLWIGTYSGLARMVDGKIVARPLGEAAFGDLVYTIFEDREQNLWVGARDGLYRLNPARFRAYAARQGLTYNNVMSVCEDQAGAIWIGTWGGGLNRLVGESVTAFGSTNGLTFDYVLALHEAHDGSLWIGMEYNGGLNRFRPNEYQNSFQKENGPISPIRVLHEDKQGALWIGTSTGLTILKDGKSRNFGGGNGFPGILVMAICEDGEGVIWIGTESGLSRWHEDAFVNYTTHEGLSHNAVDAIYEDREHILWLGTKGGGLNRFEAGRFTAYTSKQGLFSDEIYEIIEDDAGYFWMTCRNGLFRVRKKDLDAFDRHTISSIPCVSFGKADGLLSLQFNGVAKPSGWKARDGRIWFPTIRGVLAVESRISINEKPPPVVIEEIIVDKNKLRGPKQVFPGPIYVSSVTNLPAEHLVVPPGRGELEIHFAALSLQAPEKNHFKYQLEGVDPDWVDAGTRREAHYSNLGPRKYRFRVIASNNDGTWNETGASVAFVFQPHYWQTWGFKLSFPVAFALLLTLWYRLRLARLREIEQLRIQIAADLHDDVGSRLTKVAMVTELVDRETSPADITKAHIQNISRTTREIIQAMDEIVWTINPKNDTIDNLANYIFQYAQDYFQNTSVRCRMDLPPRLPDFPMPTEQRHNIFMAVKEALNNVLKHAGATEVRISLAVTNSTLTVVITDNGLGFSDGPGSAAGNGLLNMRERLEHIGGRLALDTQPGGGTRIRMEAEVG
jgi:ligand-binding sensor domain-containing protein/signal transduction histidine kinase